MKIVLISQDFSPLKGGIANYLEGIYEKYFRSTDFHVIIPSFIKSINKNKSFKVHRADFSPFTLNDKSRNIGNDQILSIIKNLNPDLILFGYIRSHPEVGLIYKRYNKYVKFGIFIHGKEAFFDSAISKINNFSGKYQKGYSQREVIFYKNIIKSADFIFSVSNFSKKLLHSQGIKRKIFVLYPSVARKILRSELTAKKRLNLSGRKIILSVGRLIKRKGHSSVISCMPLLIKRFPNLLYVIVGDGPEFFELEKQIREEKLQDYVKIYSKIDDDQLDIFYDSCDLFVLPCKFIKPNDVEGFGIVFLEAAVHGKPTIGTRTGGIPESIDNNITGYVLKSSNLKELYSKILLLLGNEKLKNRLGKTGMKRASKLFNRTKSNKLIRLFKKDISR